MDKKDKLIYRQVYNELDRSQNIALISHINPDIDTTGSATAFYDAIINNWDKKNIDLICISDIPGKYEFLLHIDKYQKDFNPDDYDLIVFFDCWASTQSWWVDTYPKLFDKKSYNTISIDHHASNDFFAKLNIVNTNYASATILIYDILKYLNLKISKRWYTNLLSWLYTDTGSFMNSNTNSLAFEIAWELVSLWAENKYVIEHFLKNNSINRLRYMWYLFKKSFIDKDWVLTASRTKDIIESFDLKDNEQTWVWNNLSIIYNTLYSRYIISDGEYIKWSLRTSSEDIDLTKVASIYGGWWHKKASGFLTRWNIEINQELLINQNLS